MLYALPFYSRLVNVVVSVVNVLCKIQDECVLSSSLVRKRAKEATEQALRFLLFLVRPEQHCWFIREEQEQEEEGGEDRRRRRRELERKHIHYVLTETHNSSNNNNNSNSKQTSPAKNKGRTRANGHKGEGDKECKEQQGMRVRDLYPLHQRSHPYFLMENNHTHIVLLFDRFLKEEGEEDEDSGLSEHHTGDTREDPLASLTPLVESVYEKLFET